MKTGPQLPAAGLFVPYVLPALLTVALFAACGQSDRATGPGNPDPQDSCLTDSTLCLPPVDSCLADSTVCESPDDSIPTDTIPNDSIPTDTVTNPGVRNCATDPVVFTEYVMDTAHIKVVAPIGAIGGGNTELVGRSYVFARDGLQGQRLPIRAPADLDVVATKHYAPIGSPPGYIPDWSLYLETGCGVSMELYHIKDVSDTIKNASDTTIYASSAWEPLPRRVRLRAGDTIGWYISGLNSVAWDFIVRNDSVTNQFANQARYEPRSNILHVVCPYDMFEPVKKAAYYALMGSVGGVRIPGASCGTVERDVVGTPSGQWFFDSSATTGLGGLQKEGFYGSPFPNIIAADSTIMFGHIGPSNDFRIERNNPTWKRIDLITTEWCYQRYPTPTTPDGWLWMKMITPLKMHVAYGDTGLCPAEFPATGYKTYYR